MTDTAISTATVATAAIATAVTTTTATIAFAGTVMRCAVLVGISRGGQLSAVGELVASVAIFRLFGLIEIVFLVSDIAEAAVVDGVFLFEIVFVLFALDAVARDLV